MTDGQNDRQIDGDGALTVSMGTHAMAELSPQSWIIEIGRNPPSIPSIFGLKFPPLGFFSCLGGFLVKGAD